MAAGGEGGEVAFQRGDGREEVREQHHEAALADDFDDALERGGEVGGGTAGRFLQREHEVAEVAGAVAGGEVFADLVVEGQHADGVALLVKEEGEGSGEGVRVGGLE